MISAPGLLLTAFCLYYLVGVVVIWAVVCGPGPNASRARQEIRHFPHKPVLLLCPLVWPWVLFGNEVEEGDDDPDGS